MITKYNYCDFKPKLTTNPKWIARGLQILDKGIPGAKLLASEKLSISVMVNQLAFGRNGGLPWTLDSTSGADAVLLVTRHAHAIYNYYVQEHAVQEQNTPTSYRSTKS